MSANELGEDDKRSLEWQRRMGVRGGDANRWVKTLGVRAPEKKGL